MRCKILAELIDRLSLFADKKAYLKVQKRITLDRIKA